MDGERILETDSKNLFEKICKVFADYPQEIDTIWTFISKPVIYERNESA